MSASPHFGQSLRACPAHTLTYWPSSFLSSLARSPTLRRSLSFSLSSLTTAANLTTAHLRPHSAAPPAASSRRCDVYVCPSPLHVALCTGKFTNGAEVAPQNCNFAGTGAASMLKVTPPWAVPQLGSCTSSGCAWRL